jgi:hypothetical protein
MSKNTKSEPQSDDQLDMLDSDSDLDDVAMINRVIREVPAGIALISAYLIVK